MLIAKIENGQVYTVADYQSLFPNTSFPSTGPSNEFMVENSCMFVNTYKPYDPNTQKLVPANPAYIEIDDPLKPLNWVYTVEVAELTPEEIAQINESKRQQNKAQATSLLQATDWTCTTFITDPEFSNPYLGNQPDFLAYRNEVRKIAVNPPIVVDVWPVKPDEVWVGSPAQKMSEAVIEEPTV
jgi:hypothetical protein